MLLTMMKLLSLLPAGLLTVILLPGCQHATAPEGRPSATASHPYQRAVLPVPVDLFAQVLARMQEPYILAGEDVEMLYQHAGQWFKNHDDTQAVTRLETATPDERAAFQAFTRQMHLPEHPKTRELLRISHKRPFPAEIVTAKDAE